MLALSDVQASLKERVQRSEIRTAKALLLVDLAVARRTFTVAQAAEALSMNPPGTRRSIERLTRLSVLAEYGECSYNRRYHAPAVLQVLLLDGR